MAPPLTIRVRLDLRKVKEYSRPSFIWLSVDTSLIHTIEDLKELIIKRINISDTDDVNLYCQDCYLPSDETIEVVRDEDLIRVHYKEEYSCIEDKHDSYSNCHTGFIGKEYRIIRKRKHDKDSGHSAKKRKSNDCAANCSFDNDSEREQGEVAEMHTDVELKNLLEEQSKKKKKKHRKDKLEVAERNSEQSFAKCKKSSSDTKDISNVLSHLMDNDSCPASNEKKKKKDKTIESSNNTIPINSETTKICASTSKQTDLKSSTKTLDSVDKKTDDNTKISASLPQPERIDKSPSNNCKKKRKRSRKRKNRTNEHNSIDKLNIEKPNIESVSKHYLDNGNNLGFQLHSSPILMNKHVKFTDVYKEGSDSIYKEGSDSIYKESSDSIYKEVSEETFADQNAHQILPFPNDGPSLVTSSSLLATTITGDAVSVSPIREDNESIDSRLNCADLVTNIQNRFKEFSKERQLTSINTNISTIYINKSQNETFNGEKKTPNNPAEKKDYKKYPILKGPPRTGDLIAYKILELSKDYCPQMSDYKEGNVINYNDEADDIEIELTNTEMTETRNRGKFDLPNTDGPTEGSVGKNKVLVNWAEMVEPRLLS